MSHEAVNWAYEQNLGRGAALSSRKFVLVTLADHAGEDGSCWPSHGRLALRTGLHRSSIKRIIDELQYSAGVLHRVSRAGTSSVVVLHLPRTFGEQWGQHDQGVLPVAGCDTPDPVDNLRYLSQGATPPLSQGEPGGGPSDARGGGPSDARRTVMNRHESPRPPERIEHVQVEARVVYKLDEETRALGLDRLRAIRAMRDSTVSGSEGEVL